MGHSGGPTDVLILVRALHEVHEEYCETTIIATRMTQFGRCTITTRGDRLPFVNIDPSAVFYVGPPWSFFFSHDSSNPSEYPLDATVWKTSYGLCAQYAVNAQMVEWT